MAPQSQEGSKREGVTLEGFAPSAQRARVAQQGKRRGKSPLRRAVEQFCVHWVVALLAVLVRCLPLRALRRLATVVAWVVGLCSVRRQRMMERNLQAVFGKRLSSSQRRRIRWQSMVNICKTMAELLKLPQLSEADLRREVSIEGLEHLDAALAQGRGAILVTAHFGNWEYAGAYLSTLGYPVSVVARDANDPLVRDLINKARFSKGVRVLQRSDVSQMMRALKANECVAILPDQHAARGAVRVRFLGLPADSPAGPALLALRTGAPIVPSFAYRQSDDHISCKALPALPIRDTGNRAADVLAITQQINDVIGEAIWKNPEQWLWLHNRWRT